MPTLHWIGKEKVINHHQDVPFRILEHKYGFDAKNGEQTQSTNSGNKIIHGDNLEALKSLLPEYEGKIKCIYIDPPYNTGNEKWVYNDNVNHPKIKKWLGEVVGKQGEDLSRHDKWLCMMYPRIKLLHKLLADDGAIFISIDDNEQANLKLLCDEIFGGQNFVTTLVWQRTFATKNDAKFFSSEHEYILVYCKDINNLKIKDLPRGAKQDSRYKNPDNDPRGSWTSTDLLRMEHRDNSVYSIKTPSGRVITPAAGTSWRHPEVEMNSLISNNEVWFGKDGDAKPRRKRFLTDVKQGVVPQTIWKHEEVGHTQEAKQQLKRILDEDKDFFATPKTVRLIEKIIYILCNKNSIILDSFAGSGTTAHAVMKLNKEDNGNRKFIIIEMEDYANTITAERVKRVAQGYGETEGLGGEFDYYTLGKPIFKEDKNLNEEIGEEKIREYIYYTETRRHLEREQTEESKYLLDTYNNTGYYFYYEPDAMTTLSHNTLSIVTERAEQYVIYADQCLIDESDLMNYGIIFKKIPRDIKRF